MRRRRDGLGKQSNEAPRGKGGLEKASGYYGPDFTAFTVGRDPKGGVDLTGCGCTLKSEAPQPRGTPHSPCCLEQLKPVGLFRLPLHPICCRKSEVPVCPCFVDGNPVCQPTMQLPFDSCPASGLTGLKN